MLLDRGFGEVVCEADNGAFVALMKPEEAVKFLLMHVSYASNFCYSNLVVFFIIKLIFHVLL